MPIAARLTRQGLPSHLIGHPTHLFHPNSSLLLTFLADPLCSDTHGYRLSDVYLGGKACLTGHQKQPSTIIDTTKSTYTISSRPSQSLFKPFSYPGFLDRDSILIPDDAQPES